jgi:hypothetical protein
MEALTILANSRFPSTSIPGVLSVARAAVCDAKSVPALAFAAIQAVFAASSGPVLVVVAVAAAAAAMRAADAAVVTPASIFENRAEINDRRSVCPALTLNVRPASGTVVWHSPTSGFGVSGVSPAPIVA